METIGVILLAAGSSSRLGRPKQLLSWRGGNLLRHAAEAAVASQLGPVLVVLGAEEDECRRALEALPVRVTVNSDWPSGMGSSIAHGMAALADQNLEALIVMLCDQPMISSETLRALMQRQRESGAQIVASRYAGTHGPPALFTAAKFPELAALRGAGGAKALFAETPSLSWIEWPEGAVDIDTAEDWARHGAGA